MRRFAPAIVLSLMVACAMTVVVRSQEPLAALSDMEIEIVSPGANTYVSGPTLLRVNVLPLASASSVVFFVDGRLVCTIVLVPYECDWDFGPKVVAHQVRVVVNPVAGKRIIQSVRTKGLDYAERVDVDVVQVTVTVTDGNGHFIKGLPESVFRVFEDDKPQTITHFASEDLPLDLIVAVDISGSMGPAMPKLKKAVKEFLGAVPSRHQVSLVGFNDNIFALTRKTTDPNERMKAVDRLGSWGATALYDVILRSLEMLGRQAGRKAIVVFTDGEDQGSHATIADVERRLQASDVTLYMIGQGKGVSLDPLKKIMQRLAAPTGGRAFFTDSIERLHEAFDDLLEELSNQYLLGFPANVKRDDTWHRIRVEVDGHDEIRARQGYRMSPRR